MSELATNSSRVFFDSSLLMGMSSPFMKDRSSSVILFTRYFLLSSVRSLEIKGSMTSNTNLSILYKSYKINNFKFNQAERYKLWQKTISLLILSIAKSILAYRSLLPMMRHVFLMFPRSMLSRMIVRTIVPSGALQSSFASTKSNPSAHL